jgi:hypothetical protein
LKLAEVFRPHLTHGLVREGLGKIRRQFLSVEHAGPRWVADFNETRDPEERAIEQRRAFELVTAWLDAWVSSRGRGSERNATSIPKRRNSLVCLQMARGLY